MAHIVAPAIAQPRTSSASRRAREALANAPFDLGAAGARRAIRRARAADYCLVNVRPSHRYAALPRINRLCPCGNLRLLVPVTVRAIIDRPRRAIRLAGQHDRRKRKQK